MLNKINELNFENDEILEHLRSMGYRKLESNTIGYDLIHKQSLLDFLQSGSNAIAYKNLLKKKYKYNKENLNDDLINQVKKKILSHKNTAIAIRSGITLHEERFKLIEYMVGGAGRNPNFDNNIFGFANQVTYSVKDELGNIVFKRRPDILFFLNGVYISLLELKYTNQSGQTARKDGVSQILGDGYYSLIETLNKNSENKDYKQDALKLFEKPIHCVTMDDSCTYLCRNISSLYNKAIKSIAQAGYTEHSFVNNFNKEFKKLPQEHIPEESGERVVDSLEMLYGKEYIYREILCYNFIVNNKGLVTPRPKQKAGVDKVISHVRKLYKKENESDPQFHIKELKARIDQLLIKQDLKEKEYERRNLLKNNKNHNSILLQYSAGFGKSNIISFLGLLLKDEVDEDNKMLFDKVVIVTDRLDLRNQIGQTVGKMNVHNKVYVEVTNRRDLIKAFNNKQKRIVILNIQKFKNIEAIKNDIASINKSNKRIAFIIDEVHRSQSGSQHFNMLDVFDNICSGNSKVTKKNLIIGLTATPSDEILVRFGEYPIYENSVVKWMPFDSYTLKEAIRDGYVLDPTKIILTYGVSFQISDSDRERIQEGILNGIISNDMYYEHPERLRIIAKNTVRLLFENCYPSIQGRGKGMLATYSKHTAIALFEMINEEIENYRKSNNFSTYKNAVVKVVFTEDSNKSGIRSARELNGNQSESDAIKEFKGATNGLMIVVDKLQTGFDDPYLSYLFLDKEISGINAVQTCCRVNRIAKNKDHCAIIDYSRDNRNESNIRNAFKHYENMVVTNIDPIEHLENIKSLYYRLSRDSIFMTLYGAWKTKNENKDMKLSREFNAEVRNLINNEEKLFNELLSTASTYARNIRVMKNLIEINEKYIIEDVEGFVKEIRNLKNGKTEDKDDIRILDFNVSNVNREVIINEKMNTFDVKSEILEASPVGSSVSALLLQIERNDITEDLIEEWQEIILDIFDLISEEDSSRSNKNRLHNEIKTNDIVDKSQGLIYFTGYFKKVLRKLRKNKKIDEKVVNQLNEIEKLLYSEYRDYIY